MDESASHELAYPSYVTSRAYLVRIQAMLLVSAFPSASLPLWWGEFQRVRGYSVVDYGVVQTASFVGGFVVGISLAWLVTRIDRRAALFSLMLCYAAALVALLVLKPALVVAVLWGFASFSQAGLESLGLAYLGYSPNAQRNNGIYVSVQTLLFGVAPLIMPFLIARLGIDGVIVLFAILLVMAMPLVAKLPGRLPELENLHHGVERLAKEHLPGRKLSGPILIAAAAAVAAYALFSWYTVTLFNFSEDFGVDRGVSVGSISLYLGMAGFIGIPGSLLAVYSGDRFGAVAPVVIGTALLVLACILFTLHRTGLAGYVAALSISSFCWSFLMPYILSIFARIDPQGRALAASYPVRGLAGIALASANTVAIGRFGLNAAAWLCAASAVLAAAAYAVATRTAARA